MNTAHEFGGLPAFVAMEAVPVLAGARDCASIRIDRAYLTTRIDAFEDADVAATLGEHVYPIVQSRDSWDELDREVEDVSVESLAEQSETLTKNFAELKEVTRLKQSFPGDSFVVPEWTETEDGATAVARMYFFASGNGPEPKEVLKRNLKALVSEDDGDFQRYQGELLGYPEASVDFYADSRKHPAIQSVDPLEDFVDENELDERTDTSVDRIVPDHFDDPRAYAYFARGFYPEPDDQAAQRKGVEVYDTLADQLDEQIVQDFFRINFVRAYATARGNQSPRHTEPAPGECSHQDLQHFLPFGLTRRLMRYA